MTVKIETIYADHFSTLAKRVHSHLELLDRNNDIISIITNAPTYPAQCSVAIYYKERPNQYSKETA